MFIEVNGVRLFTRPVGRGPLTVALHSGPGASHDYLLPQYDLLATRRALFYYDQRGGGQSPVSRGRAYFLLAELFQDLGDVPRARELYELAIECAQEQAPSKHLIAAYRGLAELLKLEGRRDEALELLERALNAQVATGIRG